MLDILDIDHTSPPAPENGPPVRDITAGVRRCFRVGTLDREAVFVEVFLRDTLTDAPNLSITGFTRRNVNCDWSSGGQIHETLADPDLKPWGGWTSERIARLAFVWRHYHLNAMEAGCEHQRQAGWTYKTHSGQSCPVCGYGIGSAWKRRDLPADVVALVWRYLRCEDPADA